VSHRAGAGSRIGAIAAEDDNSGQMPTRVLIVDDHPTFRTSARMLLECEGFEVVGEAADGATAIAAAYELHPDVVLLDVQLPDIDGFEIAARLSRSNGSGSPAVIMTSSRAAEDFGSLAAESGALGFIPKSELSGAAMNALLR
jgi:DNA-binding NarL/FixJ family response regulator